jgi:hypothetical protein
MTLAKGLVTSSCCFAFALVSCAEKQANIVVDESCTEGLRWQGPHSSGGDNTDSDDDHVGASEMHPGTRCAECHDDDGEGSSTDFVVGGTVHRSLKEPDDCFGVGGVTVVITDANKKEYTLKADQAGNFYLLRDDAPGFKTPYKAKVIYQGRVATMKEEVSDRDCAKCHSKEGDDDAPGRILVPLKIEKKAEFCGTSGCHETMYEEWKESLHAKAYTNDAFQHHCGIHGLCISCHAPQPMDLKGLAQWPRERAVDGDPPRSEGVNCITCHLRGEDTILGVYGDTGAPHAVEVQPLLQKSEGCMGCHGQWYYSDIGRQWREGKAIQDEAGCLDCHMPLVQRKVAWGEDKRLVRQHTWHGGLDPQQRKDSLELEVEVKDKLQVRLVNLAGHSLPGECGRQLWVSVSYQNADGTTVFPDNEEKKFTQKIGYADPFACYNKPAGSPQGGEFECDILPTPTQDPPLAKTPEGEDTRIPYEGTGEYTFEKPAASLNAKQVRVVIEYFSVPQMDPTSWVMLEKVVQL